MIGNGSSSTNGKRDFILFFDGIFFKVHGSGRTENVPRIVHSTVQAESRLAAEFKGKKLEGKIVGFNQKALKLLGAWSG